MNINKIAKKVFSSRFITIRQLLNTDINVNIKDDTDQWQINFSGPVKLTPDGIAKWSTLPILDKQVILNQDKAIIVNIKNQNQRKSICALFNTIANHVNENTYNKYIQK